MAHIKQAVGMALLMSLGMASAASAAQVLIFGDRGEQADVEAVLAGAGETVTNVNRPTAESLNFSTFDTIWVLNVFSSYGATIEQKLIDFVAAGGGLYMTAERPCCEAANDSIERIVNASLLSGSISVGGFGDVSGPFTYNPNAIGNMDADLAVGWLPSAPGQMEGISGNNVIVSADATGRAVAAGWNEDDLGAGRIAVFGDVNWLSGIDANERQVVLNIQEFLFDGFVGPNPTPTPSPVPLPAAGWMLLAGLGSLAAAARRRKQG